MSEKFSKNLQLNIFLTVMIGILGFITNKYFSEYMGMNNLGLMRLFSQLIAYLSLAEMGIGTASAYELYRPLSEKNYKRVNVVVSTIDTFYKRVALVIFCVGIILNIFLPFFIEDKLNMINVHIYWSLYIVNTSIGYLFAKYSILFTANQEYGYVRKIQGISKIVFQTIQVISIVVFKSFIIYIFIMILENIVIFYFYRKHYREDYSYVQEVTEKDLNINRDIKSLFWHKIGELVVFNTDYIILSKFTSLSIVAKYSSYFLIYRMVMTICGILTPILIPYIGKFIVENDESKIYKYWKELYSFYMYIGTIFVFVCYKGINPFVKLWLGEEYLLPKFTVILLMINLFINITRQITEIFKEASGYFEDIYCPILESTINFGFSLILVQRIGLNGVIIGTILSNISIIYILKPILTFRKCFKKKWSLYIKNLCICLFLTGVSLYVSEVILKNYIKFISYDSWIEWIKTSFFISFIIIVIASLFFSFNSNFRELIFRRKYGEAKS